MNIDICHHVETPLHTLCTSEQTAQASDTVEFQNFLRQSLVQSVLPCDVCSSSSHTEKVYSIEHSTIILNFHNHLKLDTTTTYLMSLTKMIQNLISGNTTNTLHTRTWNIQSTTETISETEIQYISVVFSYTNKPVCYWEIWEDMAVSKTCHIMKNINIMMKVDSEGPAPKVLECGCRNYRVLMTGCFLTPKVLSTKNYDF